AIDSERRFIEEIVDEFTAFAPGADIRTAGLDGLSRKVSNLDGVIGRGVRSDEENERRRAWILPRLRGKLEDPDSATVNPIHSDFFHRPDPRPVQDHSATLAQLSGLQLDAPSVRPESVDVEL